MYLPTQSDQIESGSSCSEDALRALRTLSWTEIYTKCPHIDINKSDLSYSFTGLTPVSEATAFQKCENRRVTWFPIGTALAAICGKYYLQQLEVIYLNKSSRILSFFIIRQSIKYLNYTHDFLRSNGRIEYVNTRMSRDKIEENVGCDRWIVLKKSSFRKLRDWIRKEVWIWWNFAILSPG